MRTCALAILMTASTYRLALGDGLAGCPCLTTVDMSSFRTPGGTSLTSIQGYELNETYGLQCRTHDAGTTPCVPSGPCNTTRAWCADTWCWVDASCSAADVEGSSYFPGGPLFSYATCGSTDRYSGFNINLNSTPRTTNLVAPLVSAISCPGLNAPSDACGPLVVGRRTFNNDWCALKAQVENGTKSFANVLRGLTLDIVVLADGEVWVEDASGGRLGGMTGEILDYVATEAGFVYNLIALPALDQMGYFTASCGADWVRWLVDQSSRADLVAQWTTGSWERQELGVSW